MWVVNFLSLNRFWTSEGFRKGGYNNRDIPEGWGGHHKPSGTEIPRGWGVKIKKPSVGGYGYFLELHIPHICQIRCIRQIRHFVGALVLSSFAWILVFGKISSNSPYLPNLLYSWALPLRWYPCLEFIRLNFGLWRNIIKFAIFVIACISGHILSESVFWVISSRRS